MKKKQWTNWSKSFTATPEQIFYPKNEQDLVSIVADARANHQKIKAIGAGHSCSYIAKIDGGYLVSLDNYNKVLDFDKAQKQVKVQAGIRIKELCRFLTFNDLALTNMGTIDHQSIAGAIATDTHGMGLSFPSLAEQIIGIKLLTATGEFLTISETENNHLFNAAKVHLGALGIVCEVTLQCVARKNLAIETQLMDFETCCQMMPDTTPNTYSRFWWIPHTGKVQYWRATQTEAKTDATNPFMDWLKGVFIGNFIHGLLLWFTRKQPEKIPTINKWMLKWVFSGQKKWVADFHLSMVLPIYVKQSVMEYAIPIAHTETVLRQLKALIETHDFKVHLPIELRFTPKSKAWMSMSYGKDVCYIGIICYQPFGASIAHEDYFRAVHKLFAKYEGVPHWAKKHYYTWAELKEKYPKFADFKKIKKEIDPKGMFENDFIKNLFQTDK